MHEAKASGCSLVVFPEMALTSFFPRWHIEDAAEIDSYFEREMPGAETRPLFDTARELGLGFVLGYCELALQGNTIHHYNSAVLVDRTGRIVGKYRKVHLPGNAAYDPDRRLQHLEAYYFEPGDLGFPVWAAFDGRVGLCLCNDRRWPETYRVMGLQGVELILLGYNTPAQLPDEPEQNHLRTFHHLVCMQAGAYQNGAWVVAAGKAGREEGCDMLGGSCVIAPSGEVVALSCTLEDELVCYRIDLDLTAPYKRFFDFATYRRPEHYGLIVERRGAGSPLG
jgi:predicted amidohydrolase